MLKQTQGPNQHFKAYYQDNSVLIQLVIAEFVHTHRLISNIKNFIDNNLLTPQQLDGSISPLFHSLNQLLGSQSNHEHAAISRWIKGPLTRMKEYCEQFSHNGESDKFHLNLHSAVYQTWLAAIHNMDLINTFRLCRTMTKNLSFSSHVQRSLKRLLSRLNIVTKQIPRVANLYWNNENVAYFLMKRKRELIDIYGEEEVNKCFKSFAKQAILTPHLIRRYQERGFTNHELEKAAGVC